MLEKVTYKDIIKFAWNYWKRRKKLGFWALFFMFIATLTDVVLPAYTGKIVDSLSLDVAEGNGEVLRSIVIFIALILGFTVFRWIAFHFWNVYECYSMRDILLDALYKVQRFSTNWHNNNFAGGTVRKITRARTSFEMFEDTFFLGLFPAVVIMFGVTAMLVIQMPSVGWFVSIMTFLYVGLSIVISVKLLAPRYKKSAAADTKVGAVLSDIVTGSPTVKAFGSEDREDKYFYDIAEDWRHKTTYSYRFTNDMDFIREILRFLMIIGMLSILYILWRQGLATPGNATLVITSYFMIGGYLREIGRHIIHLQRSISEMEDVVYFWKTDIAVKDKTDSVVLKPAQGEVVFDAITFSYGNKDTAIYDQFSIKIAPGEKVALVGHSGSGKSTFVKLLQRLYDIQGGEIRIDGQDIATVTQSSLRQAIALVPQDPILFHRSLRDNIAYAKQNASDDEIIMAAKKAYAHEFIEGLPEGYDTMVGERGVKLSGGERQRVAIARAILSDSPILILDEATSSLDSVSEHYIQMALSELMKGRTAITIAHRLSTIKNVDRILVFDKGRIVEQGTHDDLLKNKKSLYKELYDVQVLGFIE